MLKRPHEHESPADNHGNSKKPRTEASSATGGGASVTPSKAGSYPRPTFLYQQFLRHDQSHGDIFFLTRDKTSYATQMELEKTDRICLQNRLVEAGLPKNFKARPTVNTAEAPSILIQVEKDTFVSAEALLPKAHKIGKPLTELFPKDRIFIRHLTAHGEPRYFELSARMQLLPGELAATNEQALRATPHLKDNQRIQLGMEIRPHAPLNPTTKGHAEVILEKLGEPKWLAEYFPERPPLLVYGDDEVFSEGARKVSLGSQSSPNTSASPASRIFVLAKSNRPKFGVDNPEYKELSHEQYQKLNELEGYRRRHLGRLGLGERWARELDPQERFFLGIDDNPESSWSDKLRESQKRQCGITGETAKRYYVCQPSPPTHSRKSAGPNVRNLGERPDVLVETRPGVYQEVKAYKERLKQRDEYPLLQRHHNKVRVLIKFEDGSGYVTPEELKRLVGDQQFAKTMNTAMLPQYFDEETKRGRPSVLVDEGNGKTFLSAERLPGERGGKIPNYISFDRILVRTEHGNYMDLTKALSLGIAIEPETRNQLGLPPGLGQSEFTPERTNIQQEPSARSFVERERSVISR